MKKKAEAEAAERLIDSEASNDPAESQAHIYTWLVLDE